MMVRNDPDIIGPTDLAILDYDRDGYQDVLIGYGPIFASSQVTTTEPVLLANREGPSGERAFVDEASAVGLTSNELFFGLAPADYNCDGYTDLYLARETSAPFFFKGADIDPQFENNWIGVRLQSPYGAQNFDGLGSTVTVISATGMIRSQLVDGGGSGRASQHEADLVFGLGSESSPVSVIVKWPNGATQSVPALGVNQYHTIVDPSPVVDNDSVQVIKIYDPFTDTTDWKFQWDVYNASPLVSDRVYFADAIPSACQPSRNVLKESDTDVDGSVTGPVEGKWTHSLTWLDVPCETSCTYPYYVKSAQFFYTSSSDTMTFKVKTCVQSR